MMRSILKSFVSCRSKLLLRPPIWKNEDNAPWQPTRRHQGISTNQERLSKRQTIWSFIPFYQKITHTHQTFEEKLGLPPKPRRPETPFFRFRAQVYSEVAKTYPEASSLEIVVKITELWRKLDEKTKSSFMADYKTQLKAYSAELAKYKEELTDDQRELLKSERQKKTLAKKEEKEKRKLKQKMKELGKPKQPASAFCLFLGSKMDKEHPSKLGEVSSKVSNEWRNLDEDEKKVYIEDAARKLEIYRRDLQAWEEKMIHLGNTDVVRAKLLIEPCQTVKGKKKSNF